ncbi:hypothetical protein HPP92_012732 [Vanilla planifolia]|uniref:Uncharacterized protein n=1 Tax=Vanilla planifolia TaxID=51239 RepID=A0A835QRN8_VANPL|nr:hypothetical protein HPP92_012732 [Vanilla planifolia]
MSKHSLNNSISHGTKRCEDCCSSKDDRCKYYEFTGFFRRYFSSLVDIEPNGASQSRRSNSFLAALVKPFTELESIDLLLSSYLSSDSYLNEPLHRLSDLAKSDSIINSFIFDVSASFNHSLGLYQLSSVFRKKLELDKVDENLRQMIEAKNDFNYKMTMDNSEPLRSIRLGLEEYCIAQENARAARSAANAMKEHVKQRTEALYKNRRPCWKNAIFHIFYGWIFRVSANFEKTSTSAEGQIERALGWAYAGPNIVGSGNSSTTRLGIPSEFHDHLLRRKKLLWKAHEQASDIIKFCTYVIEFEASRESFSGQMKRRRLDEF